MKNVKINFETIETIATLINEEAFVQRRQGDFGFIFFDLKDKDGFVQFFVRNGEIRMFSHNFGGNFEENWKDGKRIDLTTILCFLKKQRLVEVPTERLW